MIEYEFIPGWDKPATAAELDAAKARWAATQQPAAAHATTVLGLLPPNTGDLDDALCDAINQGVLPIDALTWNENQIREWATDIVLEISKTAPKPATASAPVPTTFDRMPDCWMILITGITGLTDQVPAFDHGWQTRAGAEAQRDAMLETGHWTYGQLTIKRFAVVPKELDPPQNSDSEEPAP